MQAPAQRHASGHLVAAFDKFRGTAGASDLAAAAARAARGCGWTADEVPMADGGEGTLDAVGGTIRRTVVPGPLGRPVDAEWRMLTGRALTERALTGQALTSSGAPGSREPTAVIEMARAAGRALLPHPCGDEVLDASTAGVGHLVVAAADAGARRIVVAAGGSATTDGGWGAVEVIGSPSRLGGAELVVACDVRTPFRQAAAVFGPQKGARPDQVAVLEERLAALASRYLHRYWIDVATLPGSGAGGGLAGGMAALGARLVPGFDFVAGLVDLEGRLEAADLVVTGEGHLDRTSLDGKVVGGVIMAARGRTPVLCVVGGADPEAAVALVASEPVEVVSLTALAGPARARDEVLSLVAEVVSGRLARHRRAG